ncbi:CAP domain-containing protein [Streptomyces albogriseolus]|uniref:RCC1 domain-containing protein n=1 Tax=Streptomyces albogriseolus TaxID=1887 RepID=UPI003CFB7107
MSQTDAEAAVLCLVNEFRVANGRGELTLNSSLRTAARQHAHAAATIRWWKGGGPKIHVNPETNSTYSTRIKAAGYCPDESDPPMNENGRGPWVWGVDPPLDDFTPLSVFEWWRDSMQGHRDTMLNSLYTETGVAVVPGVCEEGGDADRPDARGYIFVQTFGGCETPTPMTLGKVWAWGHNQWGQLGDGSSTDQLSPTPVPRLGDVIAVSAGSKHSVAVKEDGSVWAWGSNHCGQLGDGTTVDSHTPVRVLGMTGAVAVACGYQHSLALKDDGSVWAWGDNYHGQIGNGSTSNGQLTPVKVAIDDGCGAVTCGWGQSYALHQAGLVSAWGASEGWRLGFASDRLHQTTPAYAIIRKIRAISAGIGHGLALQADGTLQSWGLNAYGELGIGHYFPSLPRRVPGLSDVRAIAAGIGHSLALTRSGRVWAWGDNQWGQLGNGSNVNRLTPFEVPTLDEIISLAPGLGFHCLALKRDGGVWSWGNNLKGALGNGSTTDSSVPVPLDFGAAAVAVGHHHSLAIVPSQ